VGKALNLLETQERKKKKTLHCVLMPSEIKNT